LVEFEPNGINPHVGGGLLPKCPNCQGTGIDPTIPNYNKPPNSKPEQLGNEARGKAGAVEVLNMLELVGTGNCGKDIA